jgi:hypothetical protein
MSDYETVVSWIAERAPTDVYAALVRLRLNDTVSETQKRMGEVIRQDSKEITSLRAALSRYGDHDRACEQRTNALYACTCGFVDMIAELFPGRGNLS